jgi:hypothetical protein
MAPNRSCRRASSNPATWHQGPTQAARPPPLLELAQVPRIWRARRAAGASGRVTAAALMLSACGPAVGKFNH